ncbi:MAG: hypothetical protein WKG07_45950 [Hymenobacter sp.]
MAPRRRRHHPAPAGLLGRHQLLDVQTPRPPRVLATRLRRTGARLQRPARKFNDPPIRGEARWHFMRFEVTRPRGAAHGRHWIVRHDRDGREYAILPGPDDGTAGTGGFGVGDLWVLRYSPRRDGRRPGLHHRSGAGPPRI